MICTHFQGFSDLGLGLCNSYKAKVRHLAITSVPSRSDASKLYLISCVLKEGVDDTYIFPRLLRPGIRPLL